MRARLVAGLAALIALCTAAQESGPRSRLADVRARVAELGVPASSRRARVQLEESLEEWRARDYGLAEPLDPELALASATALAALALEPERAGELLDVLRWTEERLRAVAVPGGELELALAQGWKALLATPTGARLPHEERLAALSFALDASSRIAVEEARDGFGCSLARLVHDELSALGRRDEARAVLATQLARFPSDLEVRPFLLCLLADDARVAQDWPMAVRALEEAEAVTMRQGSSSAALLRRWCAGARCRLELAFGLTDRALDAFAEEQRASLDVASDLDSRIAVLFDWSSVALAAARPEILERAGRGLAEALAEEAFLRDLPALRAQLEARQALLSAMHRFARGESPDLEALERVAKDPLQDAVHASSVDLVLLALALARTELHPFAQRSLARMQARAPATLPPETREALVAGKVLLALAEGARGAELAPLERELAPALSLFTERRAASPLRLGGLGYLAFRTRRMLLGARVELDLAYGDPGAAERAIDHLLPIQELGSLARFLGAPSGTVRDVRAELLAPGRGLLLFLPGISGLHAFCLERERVTYANVPWNYELEAQPFELGRSLADSPHSLSPAQRDERLSRLSALCDGLAQRLLPPAIRARLAELQELYVVDSGLLAEIPFEALPLGGKPLGLRMALAYLPSLPVGLELARRARADEHARPLSGLLVSSPSLSEEARRAYPQLRPFELTDEELAGLGASRRGFEELSGAEASGAHLLASLAARRPSFLNLVVHGVHDPRRELGGGLVLAPDAEGDDGVVWTEELGAADFVGPPLVALIACGSARGPRRTGDDGMALLSGVFFAHGTRCTLQAGGELALDPAVKLMSVVTAAVAEGVSPAEALRRARVEVAGLPDWRDPFYWSSMRAVGLGLVRVHPLPR